MFENKKSYKILKRNNIEVLQNNKYHIKVSLIFIN